MNAARAHKILIVDDEEKNLKLMGVILRNYGYPFETARDGTEALEKVRAVNPSLIFLDIMMPGLDGFSVCRALREDPATRHIPVVMVTAMADKESRIMALESGANDFIAKPIDPVELMVRARNLLRVKEFEDFLKHHNELLDAEVRKRTLELRLTLSELEKSEARIKEAYVDTIQRLTMVAEYKDPDTALHIRRVSHYCEALAKTLGWPGEDAETIFYASPMHDIGKVGIPSDILLKPGKLNSEEFGLVKTHTVIGARILKGSNSRILRMAEKIAISHHERWDGNGYPGGLKGEEIPLEGSIMNISDQYDALRSQRPYKRSLDHEEVVKIITEGDGRTMPSHFSPMILEAFKETHTRFREIYDRLMD